MWNPCIGATSNSPSIHRSYTLACDISAMQVLRFDDAELTLGPVSKLPKGAKIETCGGGFDKATLKVSYEGLFYFVFRQELGLLEQAASAAV